MFLHFLQKKEHIQAFIELVHIIAGADGFVSGNEKRFLRSLMNEIDIEGVLKPISPGRELEDILGDIKDDQVRSIFFIETLLLVYSDGDYSDAEKQVVLDMKRIFGISDETYEKYKDWVVRLDQLKIEGVKFILDPST
ncbi:tellurite resistance TerB family protein [Cohnella abietis]|uniref:Co-chaperone DjlA N-terminal domain-containing protein n=1 Tax=Cohnella abietis TaxID=2507935 RepID=A0A3T1CYJ6_9BACL|nr:TerB family tellurite resistance protein [Cohnella abietis]BBI30825.1 hypothetical protein KCTCHS21_02240 [Cohnella abietis]